MIYVYILRCVDDTLYTGYTVDLARRLANHQAGKASKYTRARLPVTLAYAETCATKSEAMRREAAVKKLTRAQKLELIEQYMNMDPINDEYPIKTTSNEQACEGHQDSRYKSTRADG